MSKSIPLSKPLRYVPYNEFISDISKEAGVSVNAVSAVLAAYITVIKRHLSQAEAVRHDNLCTWHLRRRDYSPERRAKVKIGINATFPEFCYYPYANISHKLRDFIASVKESINTIHQSL